MRKIFAAIFFTLFSMSCLAQDTTTLTGTVMDDSAQIWANAAWIATIIIPGGGGTAKFLDGTPVPTSYTGFLNASGIFPSTTPIVGNTAQIVPFGVTWQYCFYPVASAPSQCFNQATSGSTFAMGAYASNLIKKPFVQAASLVYAYNVNEIHDSQNGNGYLNTISGDQFYFSNGTYIQTSGGSSPCSECAFVNIQNAFVSGVPQIFQGGINLTGASETNPVFMTNSLTAPTGSCSVVGFTFSQSGAITFCNGTTYSTFGGGPPTGAAGGALAGTYPNPVIANAGQNTEGTIAQYDGANHLTGTAFGTLFYDGQFLNGFGGANWTSNIAPAFGEYFGEAVSNTLCSTTSQVGYGANTDGAITTSNSFFLGRYSTCFTAALGEGPGENSLNTFLSNFGFYRNASRWHWDDISTGSSVTDFQIESGTSSFVFLPRLAANGTILSSNNSNGEISATIISSPLSYNAMTRTLSCGTCLTSAPVSSVFARTGAVVAANGDYTVSQVTGAAPLASPTFTGVPSAPTATVGTNTTQLATTAFVLANAGSSPVTSVFTRTGAVTAQTGDYAAFYGALVSQNTWLPSAAGTGNIFAQAAGATTSCSNAALTFQNSGTNSICLYRNTGTGVWHFGDVVGGTNFAFDAAVTTSGTVTSTLGTATITSATGGTGVTSVTCVTGVTCEVARGSYTVVGGSFVTGTVVTLVWPTTTTAWVCTVIQNGGSTTFGLGHGVATATGMTITNAVTVATTTFTFDYQCEP